MWYIIEPSRAFIILVIGREFNNSITTFENECTTSLHAILPPAHFQSQFNAANKLAECELTAKIPLNARSAGQLACPQQTWEHPPQEVQGAGRGRAGAGKGRGKQGRVGRPGQGTGEQGRPGALLAVTPFFFPKGSVMAILPRRWKTIGPIGPFQSFSRQAPPR